MGKAIHICHVTSIFPRFSAAANSHTMTIEYVLTCQPQPQKQRADYRCEEQGWAGRAVGLFMRRQQHSTGSARHRSVFRRRYRLPRCQWVMTPGAGAKHRNWKNAPGGTRLTQMYFDQSYSFVTVIIWLNQRCLQRDVLESRAFTKLQTESILLLDGNAN